MKWNVNAVLIAVGSSLLLAGLWRARLMKFDGSFAINAAMTVAVLACCYYSGGGVLLKKGMVLTAQMTAGMVPTLVAIFLMMGTTMALISQEGSWISAAVRGQSGLVGTLGAASVVPGSMTAAKLVNTFWGDGKTSRLHLILFLLLIPNVNFMILAFQVMAMEPRLILVRTGLSIGVASVMLALFSLLRLFLPRSAVPVEVPA